VLCVDKTGTLTLNRMAVKQLCVGARPFDVDQAGSGALPNEFRELVEYGVLACEIDPYDPMEKQSSRLAIVIWPSGVNVISSGRSFRSMR
jgi:Ca2+-transporting ATPase